MDTQEIKPISDSASHNVEVMPNEIVSKAEQEVAKRFAKGANDKYGRFFLAALSGVPWILPLSVIANFKGELDQDGMNAAFRLWLQEHQGKLKELSETINDILTRLEGFGSTAQERIESPEYLNLVRRAFRSWDESDTNVKRLMLKKLLINAGAITLCPDDQVRLFIDWIGRYHEAHFAVMKEVYLHGPITKGAIWDNIHPNGRPRDDSAEAGLFGYLMRELNMGGIIHLQRQTNYLGQTMRATRQPSSNSSSSDTLDSPFENTKLWVLSALGKEFVRYVMEDIDPQLQAPNQEA